MAEPDRRRRKEERPGEIIAAALVEFAANGYAGTRLVDVARRAGVSHGTVHHYFAGKEALFEQVFRSAMIDSLGPIDEIVFDCTGNREALLRMIVLSAARQGGSAEALALLRILLVEGERFPELVEQFRNDVLGKGEAVLRKIIEAGIAEGEFVEGDYGKTPLMLLAPGVLATLLGSSGQGGGADTDPIAEWLDVMLSGIRAPGAG